MVSHICFSKNGYIKLTYDLTWKNHHGKRRNYKNGLLSSSCHVLSISIAREKSDRSHNRAAIGSPIFSHFYQVICIPRMQRIPWWKKKYLLQLLGQHSQLCFHCYNGSRPGVPGYITDCHSYFVPRKATGVHSGSSEWNCRIKTANKMSRALFKESSSSKTYQGDLNTDWRWQKPDRVTKLKRTSENCPIARNRGVI